MVRYTAAVATDRVYDGFGNLVSETDPSVAFDFGFQGRAWDAGAGLAYHRARWVDPSVGRFISEDPIGLGDGPNRFRFAANNPVNRTDPSGLTAAQQSPGAFSADLSLQQVDFGFSPGGFACDGYEIDPAKPRPLLRRPSRRSGANTVARHARRWSARPARATPPAASAACAIR